MADTTQVSQNAVTAAGHAFDATQKLVSDKTNDPRLSIEKAAHVAAEHLKAGGTTATILGTLLSVLSEAAAVVLDTITKSKVKGQTGVHDLIVAALGDVLQIDIATGDVPVGEGAAAQRAVNQALGGKFLDQMKTFFGADAAVTGDSAEKAAETFLGFGMQFSASVGFLGVLGELFSFGHVKELSEIGEVLERSLGLGRLTRQVMRPYIRNLISQPLDHKMRAQYRQDLLGVTELVKAALSGRMTEERARGFMAQHGLSDEFITEMLAQHRQLLHAADLELLTAVGAVTAGDASASLQEQGIAAGIAELQLKALTWKRLHPLRQAVLNEVFSQIQRGFLDSTALDDALSKLGIPADEADLWRQRVGYLEAVPRRRLSQGEMLFLFENSQLTLDQVQQWAAAEGYSQEDQLNLQLYFELKATAAHRTASGTATAAAQHVHDEHIAWVTDNFAGAFGGPPSAAELAGWVSLLDLKQRTKADLKNEWKAGTKEPPTR